MGHNTDDEDILIMSRYLYFDEKKNELAFN